MMTVGFNEANKSVCFRVVVIRVGKERKNFRSPTHVIQYGHYWGGGGQRGVAGHVELHLELFIGMLFTHAMSAFPSVLANFLIRLAPGF